MKTVLLSVTLVTILWSIAPASAAPAPASTAQCPALLSHRLDTLAGDKEDLCEYAGQVVLVVNTASYCGFTPQYKGLEELNKRYRSRGLVVLGFPSNDFGNQEPKGNADIADFCDRTYAVKFPMFSKTSVAAGASPFFDGLAKATGGQRPEWNFHKYLIARDGRSVASFPSKVEPDSKEFVAKVEALLAAPSP